MWIPLRSAKMYGFIFGFQRRVWWPKWTPASSSWRMETVGTGKDLLFGSGLRGPRRRGPDPWARHRPGRNGRACVLRRNPAGVVRGSIHEPAGV